MEQADEAVVFGDVVLDTAVLDISGGFQTAFRLAIGTHTPRRFGRASAKSMQSELTPAKN
jgi:hypothetical protein